MTIHRAARALVLILLLPVAWILGARVENTYEEPLTPERQGRIPVPIELSYADYPLTGGAHTARTLLYLDDIETLMRRDAVEVRVATFGTAPRLASAEIEVPGTDCRFTTRPGATYDNNASVTFERGNACVPGVKVSPSGPLVLTVRFEGPARVGVWTYRHEGGSPNPRVVYVRDPAWSEIGLMVELRGRWVERRGMSGYTRADLLSIMWEVRPGSGWIWGVVILSAIALAVGLPLLWISRVPGAAVWRIALVRAVGAFLAAAALASLYAVLTPPFQTPDEPHHLAEFSTVAERPHLMEEADGWSERAHVDRLRFRKDERFRPADVGRPGARWPTRHVPDTASRGAGVHALWRVLAPWTEGLSVPRTLLALRLANAAILALAVALFAGGVTFFSGLPSRSFLVFPLLLVPTLPFFGMHVSNFAPLIAAYVVVALGTTLVVLDPDRSSAAGLFLGAGWALAITLSRSAAPLGAFVGVLVLARLLAAAPGRFWPAVLFWSGLALPIVAVFSTAERTYLERMASLASGEWASVFDAVAARPWLLLVAVPVCATVESFIGRAYAAAGPVLRAGAGQCTRAGALAGAVATGALLAGSLCLTYPELARIDQGNRPDPAAYAADAVRAGLTIPRLRDPDYMSSVTFWGGFGWLETVLPGWVVSLLVFSTSVAFVALLLWIARTRDVTRAWLLLAAVLGYALALWAYAFSLASMFVPADLVGRYVFGLYLAMIIICWGRLGTARASSGISAALIAGCVSAHAYALGMIVARYF